MRDLRNDAGDPLDQFLADRIAGSNMKKRSTNHV